MDRRVVISFISSLALCSSIATGADTAAARDRIESERSGMEPAQSSELPRPVPDPAARARALAMMGATGLLLVPESTNDRVMAFDPITGDLLTPDFVPADPAHLATPIHAVLNTCTLPTILVSDQINDVVQSYDLTGSYLGVFAPAGGPNPAILDNIRGMWTEQGYVLLVTVGGGVNADAVAAFDPLTGVSAGNFVANGAGGLASPFDTLVRWDVPDVLVAGINSDAIHRYDVSGAFLGNLAPIDSFPEQIALAANGNVLVANFSGTQEGVVEFQADGTYVGTYNPAALGGYRGVYELPNGNILTTTGTGVYEIDRAGNLVDTKISGVGARFIQYVLADAALLYADDFEIGILSSCWHAAVP